MGMDKEKRIQGILDEYDQKRLLYKDYLNSLTSIITLLLEKEDFHPQSVLGRVKDRESLKKKLQGEELKGCKKTTQVTDIVGLRVLVYTWNEARVLAEKIQLWFGSTNKIRKPDPEYPAFNLRLRLDKTRAQLPEYEKFKEIPFEIQVTTVLYHSWIEQTHDVIYKKNSEKLGEVSPQSLEYIQTEYIRVKEELISPAQDKLDLLSDLTKDSIHKNKPFLPLAINKIAKSHDNNYITQVLDTLQAYTERYGDSITNTKNLIDLLAKLIVQSEQNKIIPQKTPFGTFEGKTSNDITRSCLQIFKNLQFIVNSDKEFYLKNILESIAKSYPLLSDKINKYAIKEYIEESIKPHWKGDTIFFFPSLIYLSVIDNTPLAKKTDIYADFIIKPLSGLLDLHIEKTALPTKDQFTIYSNGLPINKHSKEIIKRVLLKLEQVFTKSNSIEIKYQVIQALHRSMFYPINVPPNRELEKVIESNRNRILNFYLTNLSVSDFTLTKEIEEQVTYLPKKYRYMNRIVKELIEQLKNNKEYQNFKLLYGWDYWIISKNGLKYNHQKKREELIETIADKFDEKSLNAWVARVRRFNNALSNTPSYTQSSKDGLHILINRLAIKKPKLAEEFFEKTKGINSELLTDFLQELWKSHREIAVKVFSRYYIEKDLQYYLARAVHFMEDFPENLVMELTLNAITSDERFAISEIIRFYLHKPKINTKEEMVLKKCFDFTEKTKFVGWTNHLYINPKEKSCLETLKKNNIETILSNLLDAKEVSYNIETLLNKIIIKHGDLVIDFFLQRIYRKGISKEKENYRPIPYQFDILKFNSNKNLMPSLQKLYEKYDTSTNVLSKLYITNLCSEIWKDNPEEFNKSIQEFIREKKKGVFFTLDIAKNIGNLEIIDDAIKYIIKSKKISDKMKSSIYGVYVTTGVVSGIYGLSDSYKGKAERIGKWAEDADNKIATFGKEFSNELFKQAEIERERADKEEAERTAHFNANNYIE